MHNVYLIARREYLERVRSRSFLIMTVLIPALMGGATIIPGLLAMKSAGGTKHIVVATPSRQTGELIRNQLTENEGTAGDKTGGRPSGSMTATRYNVDVQTDVSDAERKSLTDKVGKKQLDGVIWANDNALASRKVDFITRDVSSFVDNSMIERSIGQALRLQSLKGKGLTDQDIETALKTVDLNPQSPYGEGTPNPQALFVTVFTMVMILYMTVLLYGINVMRAILEEKTSRVMEVMLSTATANEMMAGKILGVGAVGLTQIAIWAAAGLVFFGAGLLAATTTMKGVLSAKLVIFFAIYFLLGYAVYSTLCAAIGSMVNSEQEAQQLQFFVMMPLILSIIIMVNIIQYPASPVAFWASMFPLTSPLIMFTRIALQTVPWWQIALSIALLLATVYGLVLLCGRIYRVGVLMYGKKPTLPEIIKWIKYA